MHVEVLCLMLTRQLYIRGPAPCKDPVSLLRYKQLQLAYSPFSLVKLGVTCSKLECLIGIKTGFESCLLYSGARCYLECVLIKEIQYSQRRNNLAFPPATLYNYIVLQQ